MNNPGVIPLQGDSVWQNSNGVANLKDVINNVDISKITTFSSLGNRILGDMSNATISNRLLFQTSALNSYTSFGLIPNGIHDTSSISLFNSSNPDNSSNGYFSIDSTSLNIQSGKSGSGSYLPINFNTGGITRFTLDTDGLLFIENIANYPIVTTNKLYASGGDLYWNVTKLNGTGGGGSGGSSTISGTLGENIAAGQPVYQNITDNKWYLAIAQENYLTNLSVCLTGGNYNNTGTFTRYGTISGLNGLPVSSEIYLSQTIFGGYDTTANSIGIVSFIGTTNSSGTSINATVSLTAYTATISTTGNIPIQTGSIGLDAVFMLMGC